MYSVRYRNIAKIDAEIANATMFAPANAGRRNSARSSIGLLWARSSDHERDDQHRRGDEQPTISVEPQPFSLPCTSAKTSRNSDAENVTRPRQSTPLALGSRDSATCVSVSEHGEDADRHVDEEDPLPADARGDDAAEQRADRDGGAGHGAVDAERGAALLAVERLRDQRERGREHHRPADALHGAREVQHQRRAARGRRRARRP